MAKFSLPEGDRCSVYYGVSSIYNQYVLVSIHKK